MGTAPSGGKALEIFEEYGPDLVLADIMMGSVGGIEVLKAAKKKRPSTMVILLTGFAADESTEDAMKLGAWAYLEKPCSVENLPEKLSKRLARQDRMQKSGTALDGLNNRAQLPLLDGNLGLCPR